MPGHERPERLDRTVLGDRVRVGDQDQLAARRGCARVDVRGEAERARLLDHAGAERIGGRAPRQIRDHDRLVDLRQERRQRPSQHAGSGQDHRQGWRHGDTARQVRLEGSHS